MFPPGPPFTSKPRIPGWQSASRGCQRTPYAHRGPGPRGLWMRQIAGALVGHWRCFQNTHPPYERAPAVIAMSTIEYGKKGYAELRHENPCFMGITSASMDVEKPLR
jgi:hypothetical protein